MNHIQSIQFMTDDGECISVFIDQAIAEIDDDGNVVLQVPVFADERSGHLYLTEKEIGIIRKSPIMREATRWALMSRSTSQS